MKILNSLTGEAVEGAWSDPQGVRSAVADEPVRGFFRQVQLGPAGLVVMHGDRAVGIPLALILSMAEGIEPGLKPTPEETMKTVTA